MKAVVAAFNQEKALVGAFSVIVQPVVEPMEQYTALTKVGLVMGRGGETIRHICLHSGAHCQVDKNAPDGAREKNIVIKGRPGNVQKAKVSFNRRKICLVKIFFQFKGYGEREGWGLEPAVFHQPDRVRAQGGAAGLQPAVGGVLSVGVRKTV